MEKLTLDVTKEGYTVTIETETKVYKSETKWTSSGATTKKPIADNDDICDELKDCLSGFALYEFAEALKIQSEIER